MWLREDRKHQVLVKTWSLTNLETKFAVFTFSIAAAAGQYKLHCQIGFISKTLPNKLHRLLLPKNTVCALAVGQWCKPAHLLLHYCRIPLSLSFSLSFSGGEGDICLSFPDIPPPAIQQGCPHHFFPFIFCFEKKVYPFKGRSNKSKEQTILFVFFILEKTQCNIQFTSIFNY